MKLNSNATPDQREVWSIGDLRLDVGQQRLWRGSDEIALPKLSFDLLLALARRAPDVVTYDELMDRVWPGLVVSPETIVQRVRLLRAAIGDDASEPRYVEALRSRGYRLLARAARASATAASPPPPDAGFTRDPALVSAQATVPPPAPAPESGSVPASGHPSRSGPGAGPGGVTSYSTGRSPLSRRALLFAAAVLFVVLGIVALPSLRSPDRAPGGMTAQADVATAPSVATTPTTPANAAAGFEATERARRTVAVLPFENLSPAPEDDFIAVAVPESMLDRLAALRGLTVIARDSAFQAGREDRGARDTGARLGAGWLVQGSVQRSGDRVRVTARLVDAPADAQVWSERFDRPLAALPALQDELATRVADALATRLAGLQRNVQGRDYSQDVAANLAYLRGRSLLDRITVAGAEAAAAQFEEAIARDPRFAAAHAALYDARLQAAALRRAGLAAARTTHAPLIERALELDPRCGAAYLARARWSDAPPAARDADFRRGLELEPSNARGLDGYAEFLERQGRQAEAARWLAQELLVDPLSAPAHFRRAVQALDPSGAGVERAMLGVLERDPNFYPALQRYAKYRWQLSGEVAQAIGIIERAIAADPENPWGRHTAAVFYLDLADLQAARDVAAATPVSAASTRPLIALYEGRDAEAGRDALDRESQAFNQFESWGVQEALRDAALRAGAPAGSPHERSLDERFARSAGSGTAPIGIGNYRARIMLAQLRLARSTTREARTAPLAQLRELVAWMDANERFGLHHQPRAMALQLLGETDRALAELAASFTQDHDYRQWWYVLERDPTWTALHADPRFRAIVDRAREHVRRERAALEALRRAGKVPMRGAAPAAVALVRSRPSSS